MVDRHASEDEREPVAERVRVDAETDPKPGSCHATDANAPGSSASDSIAIAPGGVGWSLPQGPRRRWTETSPAPSAGPASLSARSPTYATSAADMPAISTSRSKNAGSGFRTPRLDEPVTTSTGSSDERAHSSSAAVWFPATPTNSRVRAQALQAVERVRVEVVDRVDDRFPCPGRRARGRDAARAPNAPRSGRSSRPVPPTRRVGRPRRPRRRHASSAPRRPGSPPRRRRLPARSRAVVLHEPGDELEVVRGRHLHESRVSRDDRDPTACPLDERGAVGGARELAGVGRA